MPISSGQRSRHSYGRSLGGTTLDHGRVFIYAVITLIFSLSVSARVSAAGDRPDKSLRDVTPPGMVRAFRSGDLPDFTPKDAQWFSNVRVDENGLLHADWMILRLYGIVLPQRRKLCKTTTGARWTCGNYALMALRSLIDRKSIACVFKDPEQITVASCRVDKVDVARWMLQEGWAELADGNSDPAYVNASKLAHAKKIGLWSNEVPSPISVTDGWPNATTDTRPD